jgi:hypothetical protein
LPEACPLFLLPAFVLAKHDGLQPLPELNAACTKKCHRKAAKELNSNADDDSGRKGNWDADGKEGPSDPNTSSIKILVDWWMEEGNYVLFCGKQNDGIKKIQFCNMLAEKMTKETSSKRQGKNVLNKIQHIERSFRDAHSFAESETGAGLLSNDGEATFETIVKKKFPYYYDLKEIMVDRASTKPKVTSYDTDDDDDDSSEDDEDEAAVEGTSKNGDSNGKRKTSVVQRESVTSDISNNDEQTAQLASGVTATPSAAGSTKRSGKSSSSKKKNEKKGSRLHR